MLSRSFIVLWIAMAVAVAGIAMVSPLLPIYVRDELGGPEFAVALSFSAIAITQIIASPIVGRYADRFGSKPFIVVGFVIYGLGAVGYIVAPSWELIIVFRALSGVGAASIFPTAMAYVGRLAPPGHEGRYMGAFSISWIAGFGVGPLIGGSIRDFVSSDAAFAVMALMLFAVGAATFLLLPNRPEGGDGQTLDRDEEGLVRGLSLWQMLRRPIVQAAAGGQMIVSIGWGAGFTFIAVYIISDDGLATGSATFVGVLLASRALFTAAVQLITGPLADRVSRVWLSVVGFSIAGTAQFVVPDIPATMFSLSIFGGELVIVPWLLLLFLVVGLGEAIEFPAQQAIFVDAGRLVGMGSVMGITQTGGGIGFLGGSLIGALIVELYGLEAVFRYAGLAMIAGALILYLLMRRARGDFAMIAADAEAELRTRFPAPDAAPAEPALEAAGAAERD
ncbi:MAG: MFS transporter [Chloroflexi bacterium]|nr:MFS transporter [Chloroflexota bacterium]